MEDRETRPSSVGKYSPKGIFLIFYRLFAKIASLVRRTFLWRKLCGLIADTENLLWFRRHVRLKKKPDAIFLHSLFRSGSTYIFNKFRNEPGFWCYYEPLHHQLAELRKDRLDVFSFDKEASARMGHPHLQRPHFYEFQAVLRKDRIPFFNIRMSYDEFISVRQHARLYKYIATLLVQSPERTVPLLQFNRSSLRIGWFKEFFDNSLHVYMLRDQRSQFESYFKLKPGHKYNIFLALNLYIIAYNCKYYKFAEAYSSFSKDFSITHDFYSDLRKLGELTAEIDSKVHYRIFLHLWITSLVEAKKHADLILDMDKLSSSAEYRNNIVQQVSGRFAVSPAIFDDCHISRYNIFSLDEKSFREAEEEVSRLYAKELADIHFDFPRETNGNDFVSQSTLNFS